MSLPETPEEEAERINFDRLVTLAAGIAAGTNWMEIEPSDDAERREARRIARRAQMILDALDPP